MMRARRIGAIVLVVVFGLGAMACSSDSAEDDPTVSTAPTSSGSTSSGSSAPATGACLSLPATPIETPPTTAPTGVPKLSLTEIAKVTSPTAVATRCREENLYITEQAGIVKRVALDDPAAPTSGTAVLDISNRVTAGGEQGLLGIAFAPDGTSVFLAYTNKDNNQELDRFTVANDGSIDAGSRTELLTVPDFASNHNGGQLLFDSSGYLYWGMGDGGGAGDPKNTGQDPKDLLGDILRIDPFHPSDGKPYGIPSTNPFTPANGKTGAPEVYAYGLRNPWRFSIDATDALWIADVGQNAFEEIDHITPDGANGANFGWSQMEGSHPYNGGTNPKGAILPVYDYGRSDGCAVVGGFVYRGAKVPGLVGTYVFGDYCESGLKGLQLATDGSATYKVVDLGLGVGTLSTFGQDVDGELYALSLQGSVVRIDPA